MAHHRFAPVGSHLSERVVTDLQGQIDALGSAVAAVLAEQQRTNDLLAGIREALHLDDKKAAESFLYWRINAEGHRERAFDTAAFFANYHARYGNGVPFESSKEPAAED
jgi:hypothetical protein